jgi:hypothetical protein
MFLFPSERLASVWWDHSFFKVVVFQGVAVRFQVGAWPCEGCFRVGFVRSRRLVR